MNPRSLESRNNPGQLVIHLATHLKSGGTLRNLFCRRSDGVHAQQGGSPCRDESGDDGRCPFFFLTQDALHKLQLSRHCVHVDQRKSTAPPSSSSYHHHQQQILNPTTFVPSSENCFFHLFIYLSNGLWPLRLKFQTIFVET